MYDLDGGIDVCMYIVVAVAVMVDTYIMDGFATFVTTEAKG